MRFFDSILSRVRTTSTASLALIALAACAEPTNDESQTAPRFTATLDPQVSVAEGGIARLPYGERPILDDIIYFVLPDRFENGDPSNDQGGLSGGVLDHGYDPNNPKFYHGGDLKGLTNRLDYLQELGVTAIWFTPVYKNKPVQGIAGDYASGYHGYWVTDFTRVDPHLGDPADFRAFVDAAHARDMKVILDIITNHTADVIKYRECSDPDWQGEEKLDHCAYRSRADYPYHLYKGDPTRVINEGFLGDSAEHQTAENFARLTRPDYAYTPYTEDSERTIKVPAWLNDPIYYHNRGETTFEGENSISGDFIGLDDVFTEHPRVVQGFIDIYKQWITDFRIDGYRVDTVKHVNGEFWQQFAPAIVEHAKSEGIEEFYVFGEVYSADADLLSEFTNVHKLPAVLDFGFQQAVVEYASGERGPEAMAELFANDIKYTNGEDAELLLPTFMGNHDIGRFGHLIAKARPDMSDEEFVARTILGHGLMVFGRGVPVIYYGDEQGFIGIGNDFGSRETMFPSQVDIYNEIDLIGTSATTADANFDVTHPIFRALSKFHAVHQMEPALRRGKQSVLRADAGPGLLALNRQIKGATDHVLIVANTAAMPMTYRVDFESASNVQSLVGACGTPAADGRSLELTVAPLELRVCKIIQ